MASNLKRGLVALAIVGAACWVCAPRQFEALLRATASYPGAVKAFTTKNLGDVVQAAHINDVQDEITAIEQALLTVGFAHDVFPSTDAARSNGTSSLQWLDMFASRKVRAGILNYRDATTLTISAGVVTNTRSYHAIDTEGAAASDDLDTITAGTGVEAGALLTLRAANVARVVTLKNGTGNLLLNGDYAMSATNRTITLLYDGTNWRELARSFTASGQVSLLKANSGTDTNAGATNVDTIAITGLTAKDTLWVLFDVESVTQDSAGARLYNSTDSITIAQGNGTSPITTANGMVTSEARIRQAQSAATRIVGTCRSVPIGSAPTGENGSAIVSTFTQNWTGSWTLALRHDGVTAGGTFKWTWAVYKVAGQ